MKPLAALTLVQLRKIAAELAVPGRSKLRKAALIAAIEDARAAAAPAEWTPRPAAELTAADGIPTPAAAAATAATEDAVVVDAASDVAPAEPSKEAPLPKRHPFEDAAPTLEPLLLGGIPIGYDRDHLELKVQSPHTVFCYWSLREYDDHVMSGRARVRLFDVTSGTRVHVRTEPVDPSAGRWFIHDLAPDRAWVVDFGVDLEDGFEVRLESKAVRTPPLAVSRIDDVALVTLSFRDDGRPAPAPVIPVVAPGVISADLRTVAGLRPFEPSAGDGASEWDHGAAVRGAEGIAVVPTEAPATGSPSPEPSWGSHTLGA